MEKKEDNPTLSISIASFDLLNGVKVVSEWIFSKENMEKYKYTHEDIFKLTLANVHRQREDSFLNDKSFTSITEVQEFGIFVLANIFFIQKKPYNVYYGVCIILDAKFVVDSEHVTPSLTSRCKSLTQLTKSVIEQQTKTQLSININAIYNTASSASSSPKTMAGNRTEKQKDSKEHAPQKQGSPVQPSSLPSSLGQDIDMMEKCKNKDEKDAEKANEQKEPRKAKDDTSIEPIDPIKLAMDKYVETIRNDCNLYITSHAVRSPTLDPEPEDSIFLSHVVSSHLQTQMTTCIVRGSTAITDILQVSADQGSSQSSKTEQMSDDEYEESISSECVDEDVHQLFNILTHFTLDYQLEHSCPTIRKKNVSGLFLQCVDVQYVEESGLLEFMLSFDTPTTLVFLPSRTIITTPGSEKQSQWHKEFSKLLTYDDINRSKTLQQIKQQYIKTVHLVNHAAPLATSTISLIMQMDTSCQALIASQQMERLIDTAMCVSSLIDEIVIKNSPQASTRSTESVDSNKENKQGPVNSSPARGRSRAPSITQAPQMIDLYPPSSSLTLNRSNSFSTTCLSPDNIADIIRELHLSGREDFQLLLSIGQLFDKSIFRKVYGNKH